MIFIFEMDNEGYAVGTRVSTPKGRGEIISVNPHHHKPYEVRLTTGVIERFRPIDIKLDKNRKKYL